MSSSQSNQPSDSGESPEDVVDLRKLFFKLLSYWHYFAITLAVALICSFHNRHTRPTYRVTSTLPIEEDKQSGAMGADKLLQGFGLNPGMQNLDNQILILTSWSLIGRALDSLPFGIEYYYHGRINKLSLYPGHPINVIPDTAGKLPVDIEFTINSLGNNKFALSAKSNGTLDFQKEASFREKIKVGEGIFSIERDSINWKSELEDRDLYFIIHSRDNLLESYKKRLKVEPATREATIVKLSLEGNNKEMDIDFLNKLAEVFLNYNLDKKNKEANRTIEFIDEQLVGISDSLRITEGALQKFRSKNMVMNLSAQGQVIIDQAMNLENEKAILVIEANYFKYLADYLSKDNVGEVPIAPATIGIIDPGLAKLVMDLTEIQGLFYSKSIGDKNPMQGQIAQRLKNTKDALKETLNGVMRANELAMKENLTQIRAIGSKAAELPVTERNLGIERQFKLNDVLYTFLLEKKSEARSGKKHQTHLTTK